MKYIISAFLWVYGLTVFGLAILVSLILTYITPEKFWDSAIKKIMRGFFKLIGVRVTTEGTEHIDKNSAYIIMPNHVSFFDAPLVQTMPLALKGIEADSHFKWPVYGLMLKRYGNIPINRNNVRSSLKTLESATKIVKNGKSLLIFPEGTRTIDGQLGELKKLPFRLVKENNFPILPVGYSGLYSMNAKGSFFINLGPLKVKFGEPISSEYVKTHTIDEIMALTRERILALIERP